MALVYRGSPHRRKLLLQPTLSLNSQARFKAENMCERLTNHDSWHDAATDESTDMDLWPAPLTIRKRPILPLVQSGDADYHLQNPFHSVASTRSSAPGSSRHSTLLASDSPPPNGEWPNLGIPKVRQTSSKYMFQSGGKGHTRRGLNLPASDKTHRNIIQTDYVRRGPLFQSTIILSPNISKMKKALPVSLRAGRYLSFSTHWTRESAGIRLGDYQKQNQAMCRCSRPILSLSTAIIHKALVSIFLYASTSPRKTSSTD